MCGVVITLCLSSSVSFPHFNLSFYKSLVQVKSSFLVSFGNSTLLLGSIIHFDLLECLTFSSQKPPVWGKCIIVGMFCLWLCTKFVFYFFIRNSRWMPLQDKLLALDPMGKWIQIWLTPNFTKYSLFMWICNTRWPPPQNKVLVNDPLEKQMHIFLGTADPINP